MLALVLVVCLGGLYLVKSKRSTTPINETPSPPSREIASRPFVEAEMGKIMAVIIRRANDASLWKFERRDGETVTGASDWWMVEPYEFRATAWEVEKYTRFILGAEYTQYYDSIGSGNGWSEAEAGLSPAKYTAQFVDESGKNVGIEIGATISSNQTYARVKNSSRISIVDFDTASLFQDNPLAYKDTSVWQIAPADVSRVEIVQRQKNGEQTRYTFSRSGESWEFVEPFSGPATWKVDELVASLARLRINKWRDHIPGTFALFGLDTPAIKARVITEEKVYEVHISDQSPIGEAQRLYIRVADEAFVGSIDRSVANRLHVKPDDWRDKHLIRGDVESASRVTIDLADRSAFTLLKRDGVWFFGDDSGRRAEDAMVEALLGELGTITVTGFADDWNPANDSEFGFDAPQARIEVKLPDRPEAVTLTIGAFTNPQLKRLVYVRGDSVVVGKARIQELKPLLVAREAYQSLLVTNIPIKQVQDIKIERFEPVTKEIVNIRLEREHEKSWTMTTPSSNGLMDDRVSELVDALTHLRAIQSYLGNIPKDDESTIRVVLETPTEPTGLTFFVTGEQCIVRREADGSLFLAPTKLVELLRSEFRRTRLFDFEPGNVTGFSLTFSGTTHSFSKDGKEWRYAAEPDWPLDQSAVTNLLLRIRDMRAVRYIDSIAPADAHFGHDDPIMTVEIVLADGTTSTLQLGPVKQEPNIMGSVARLIETERTVLIAATTVDQLHFKLEDLEAK